MNVPLVPLARRAGIDDGLSLVGSGVLAGYAIALIALVAAIAWSCPIARLADAFRSSEFSTALRLTALTSVLSTAIAMALAVPAGYRLSRSRFPGKTALEVLIDLPMVLSPLVIGMGMLLLAASPPGAALERWLDAHGLPLRPGVAGVVLGQLAIGVSFAIRAARAAFDLVDPRQEQVAMTLGCSAFAAFRHVAVPQARRGLVVAATLAWARAIGEFGPLVIFVGIVPFRTEVLSTAVFLQWSAGDLEAAAIAALCMVMLALAVSIAVRTLGGRRS